MKGLDLKLCPNKSDVLLKLEPLLLESALDALAIMQAFNRSEYADFFINENAIFTACDLLQDALQKNDMEPVHAVIAHAKDAEIDITLSGDKMVAEITLTSPYMGKMPDLDEILAILQSHKVVRGISNKRIQKLLDSAADAKGGRHFTGLVAKGLPSRVGKDSYIKGLVPNALERMLSPKFTEDKKVDMREFGDIICVLKNQTIAQRMPPTLGRIGFTVFGKKLFPEPGVWKKINMGKHVYIDEDDENIVIADIAGLPKISGAKVEVDDVFITKGVNVATGNVEFDGSIVVNGDITEKMQVIAKGDITVNGFIESAYIKAGGNIIVTQGASGKIDSVDCEFIAGGTIYIGHAQGVKITASKDLIVDKQLAYSQVNCKGNITIGKVNAPLGKLFASTLLCSKTIRAGYVGAVSGSSLVIDYGESYNKMIESHDKLVEQFDTLSSTNADHEIKIAKIRNRKPNIELTAKLALITQELELERVFLNWLRINVEESKELLDNFAKGATVMANRALYHGVSIKFNNKNWLAKKDYGKCQVILENKDWTYIPLI